MLNNLKDKTVYDITISAENSFAASELSESVSFEFRRQPVPPQNLRFEPNAELNYGELVLAWDPTEDSATGAATYELYLSAGSDYSNQMFSLVESGLTDAAFTVRGLEFGQTYFFVVTSVYHGDQVSSYSDVLEIVYSRVPGDELGLREDEGMRTGDSVVLVWNAPKSWVESD